jgi:hypothetical protein
MALLFDLSDCNNDQSKKVTKINKVDTWHTLDFGKWLFRNLYKKGTHSRKICGNNEYLRSQKQIQVVVSKLD